MDDIVVREYDLDWGWNSGEYPHSRATWKETHGQDARIVPKEPLHQIEESWIIENHVENEEGEFQGGGIIPQMPIRFKGGESLKMTIESDR